MEKVIISSLEMIGENQRGVTYSGKADGRNDFLVIRRHANTLNGCHFHKGKAKDKDPEVLYMMEGEAKLYCYDFLNGEEGNFTIKSFSRVEIFPYVWHELNALTDILFLEMNGLEAHKQDTFFETDSKLGNGYLRST